MISLNRPAILAVAAAALLVLLIGIAAVWAISAGGLTEDFAGYVRAMFGQPFPLESLSK